MSVYTGDFLGFQLGEFHSSQLNITRVSDGDRYTETLLPKFNDTTVTVPGGDGTYYWDTFYTQREFIIDFAFDDLRDEDIRRLKQVLYFKGIQPLIFDEAPYKKYMVKCSAPPELKYIAFQHGEVTVYKGEGSINLISYYPYGVGSVEVSIDSSALVSVDSGSELSQLSFKTVVFNQGDLPAYPQIYINLPESIDAPRIAINLELRSDQDEAPIGSLALKGLKDEYATTSGELDDYLCIDMKTHLIEGYKNNQRSGHLYNKFLSSGDFFTIPVGTNYIYYDGTPNNNTRHRKWNSMNFHYLYY